MTNAIMGHASICGGREYLTEVLDAMSYTYAFVDSDYYKYSSNHYLGLPIWYCKLAERLL